MNHPFLLEAGTKAETPHHIKFKLFRVDSDAT
jgi:hypothetical protein